MDDAAGLLIHFGSPTRSGAEDNEATSGHVSPPRAARPLVTGSPEINVGGAAGPDADWLTSPEVWERDLSSGVEWDISHALVTDDEASVGIVWRGRWRWRTWPAHGTR